MTTKVTTRAAKTNTSARKSNVKRLDSITPGELLMEEFMLPMGLSAGYWLRAQTAHDFEVAQANIGKSLETIKPWSSRVA